MKSKISLLIATIVVAGLILVPAHVFAQPASSSPLLDKAQLNQTRNDKAGRINRYWATIKQRLAFSIAAEENRINRIQARLAQIKAQGGSTTTAEAQLREAEARLVKVKADLLVLQTRIDATDVNANTGLFVTNIKGDIKPLRQELKKIHKLIQDGDAESTNARRTR